jgi:hypothetical protein
MSDVVNYGWLKVERAFRMEVKEAGYGAREIVPVGEQLYDPQLMGKSCSTGEYHHPDGSIYAITAG